MASDLWRKLALCHRQLKGLWLLVKEKVRNTSLYTAGFKEKKEHSTSLSLVYMQASMYIWVKGTQYKALGWKRNGVRVSQCFSSAFMGFDWRRSSKKAEELSVLNRVEGSNSLNTQIFSSSLEIKLRMHKTILEILDKIKSFHLYLNHSLPHPQGIKIHKLKEDFWLYFKNCDSKNHGLCLLFLSVDCADSSSLRVWALLWKSCFPTEMNSRYTESGQTCEFQLTW